MIDENRLTLMLEDYKNQLNALSSSTPNPSGEQTLQMVKIKERIDLIKVIIGEERKKILFDQMKEMNLTEWEIVRGSILVIENLLITRGFTNQEELQRNLIQVVKHLRDRSIGA
jgi:hypothetical protein